MTAPDAERDALLNQLLDEALAEAAARGSIDWSGWRTRHPDHVEELRRLLEMRQFLDTAVVACRTPSGDVVAERPGPLPERIDRYPVLGRVGAGGMGTVVKAYDEQLSRVVAIKVMRLDGPGTSEAELRGRFQREARAAASVQHPHVCPIHALGEHDGAPTS